MIISDLYLILHQFIYFYDIIKNYTDYKKLCFEYNTNTINLNIFQKQIQTIKLQL